MSSLGSSLAGTRLFLTGFPCLISPAFRSVARSRLPTSARGIGGAPPQRLWPRHVALVDRLWRKLSEANAAGKRLKAEAQRFCSEQCRGIIMKDQGMGHGARAAELPRDDGAGADAEPC